MPVEVFPPEDGKVIRAFVTCEERNFGRVKIPPAQLQQWHLTQRQIARWITDTLDLRFSGKRLNSESLLELGLLSGDKHSQMLCLQTNDELLLVAGSNHLPLLDAININDGALSLNADLIRQLVDTSSTGDARYTPSTARREVRKQETIAMYGQWRKAYRELKKKRPNMSDVWYSQQIAKLDIALGRDAETIRKQMKK